MSVIFISVFLFLAERIPIDSLTFSIQAVTYHMSTAALFLDLLFYSEDGGTTFLRNVSTC